MSVDIIQGDARAVLAGLAPQSVQAVITSPPYFGLRSYGGGAQEIGAEETPAAYVVHVVEVFRAVHRVLRNDGTCWIVIGDGYANDTKWGGNGSGPTTKNGTSGRGGYAGQKAKRHTGLKPKDLMMIPHRVALALQADGWYVRQELVWSKPAPMPESVTDRCTRSHEFIFMLAKKPAYYYDAVAIAESLVKGNARADYCGGKTGVNGLGRVSARPRVQHATRNKRSVWTIGPQPLADEHYAAFPEALVTPMVLAGTSEAGCCPRCGAPYRRVVERSQSLLDATRPQARRATELAVRAGLTDAHIKAIQATGITDTGKALQTQNGAGHNAPDVQALADEAKRALGGYYREYLLAPHTSMGWQAGCSCDAGPPLGCTTLDPFLGSGTVALVSKRLGRSCVGIELNPSYCELAQRRVESIPYTLFSPTSTTGAAR